MLLVDELEKTMYGSAIVKDIKEHGFIKACIIHEEQ